MSDRIAVLNRGICVQCDAPERLFLRPRTRFVAGFFRGCNVVDGELVRLEGDRAEIRVAGASATALANGRHPSATARVGVAVRAENVHLGDRVAACDMRLEVALDEIVYRGTNVDHLLRLADGQRLVATSTRREVDRSATGVEVGLNENELILLDD